jgi:tetratricopeptide (TPR) repeat protein
MTRHASLIAIGLLCVYVSSCSNTKQSTLGQLEYQPEEEAPIAFEKLSHAQVREEYKELLDVFEDDKLKEQIERRIADVYMMEGGHKQLTETQQPNHYVGAIKAYQNILALYPNSPDNAEVLYQLAKAYDMEMQQDQAKAMLIELTTRHPNYINNGEAYFRLADILYGEQDYKNASQAYTAVTQRDNQKLHLNAHYMLAWSQYKLTNFRASANSFAFVLASYLGDNEDITALDKGQQSIAEDTLHALSLALDKIGGAGSVASITALNEKPYTWLIYHELGNYYFEKQLYENSASAYRHFLEANPLSLRAPDFHGKIIETYTKGSFPRLALEEKRRYIEHFGIASLYYKKLGAQENTLAQLKIYIDELARHHYSMGTEAANNLDALNALKKPKPDKVKKAHKTKITEYANAANYYGQYIDTFPNDERFDEIVFLQAEAFFISDQFGKAATGYEHVAYTPKADSAKDHAADAGYAAILSHQKHVKTFSENSDEHVQGQKSAVDSMLRFSKVYHTDERSPGVLTNAAEFLFSLDQYQRAIDIGTSLITDNKQLDNELKKTAHGIVAHSYFKLEDYANAQTHYIKQRQLTTPESDEYTAISERLASTTYKNSEQKIATNDFDGAIEELLRVKSLTPDSPVRVIAQYDAATLMLKQSYWSRAIVELNQLISLFPEHELAAELPRKLAYAYKSNKDWSLAAASYLKLHKNDGNDEIRREALFTAAEMFEQNSNYDSAIEHFKAYAYAYEEPFDVRMEARYKLAINYARIDEAGKSLYWLRRIIAGNKNAGDLQSARSRWLASWAHNEYGDSFAREFKVRKLSLPIVRSLPKKKASMENAIEHYGKAADFGILEFVTMSGFKIAGLYTDLASSVRKSPRPKGLSSEDKEMYNNIMIQQAAPLDTQAIELHLSNAERAWQGQYNEWIEASFVQLKLLAPKRFNKEEQLASYGNEIH